MLVEIEAPYDIEYRDPNLEKILRLTQADMRFMDNLTSTIEESDDTTWEGSDAWIRSQFKLYLLGLLSSSMTTDSKPRDDYGKPFVDALTKTRSHKVSYERSLFSLDKMVTVV